MRKLVARCLQQRACAATAVPERSHIDVIDPVESYFHVLREEEKARLERVKWSIKCENTAHDNSQEHHWIRTLNGEYGPNQYGVHLTYTAHVKHNRGSRGRWGLVYRSVGRLYLKKKNS
mmetsp:Transcript_57798/g.135121  ORF Transcript_57798/g.135121 Transcript_57798/m.135121 type:complete len:119 (+) Transcript_57798:76-432(+)